MYKKAIVSPGVTQGAWMAPTGSLSSVARGLADRLVGVAIPPVVLRSREGFPVNLGKWASGAGLVIYTYPGATGCPRDGEDTALMDAVQYRAFRDAQPELEARGYKMIEISSQPEEPRRRAVAEKGLTHRLLSDPALQLAHELELPTFTVDAVCCYRRLTLVATRGRIGKVFFPVSSPARSAAQVIAWMKIRGIG
jgi:peroxiredoxin